MDQEGEYVRLVSDFMAKSYNTSKIQEMLNSKKTRLILSLDQLRDYNEDLYKDLIANPLKILKIFESQLNHYVEEDLAAHSDEKESFRAKNLKLNMSTKYKIGWEGTFGKNSLSPRGLCAQVTNQLVSVQGIVTRMSLVRPKLSSSVHYCEETRQGSIKEYNDQYSLSQSTEASAPGQVQSMNFMSNSVPLKDIHGNALSFEYGHSSFRDFQTLLIQEPPERTPVGQLPRSVEVVLEDDLIDKVKPGDRVQISGVFKCIVSGSSTTSGTFKSVLIATDVNTLNTEIEAPKLTGEDIRKIKEISNRKDCLDVLSNSLSPTIFGHNDIKKALILQLLGGAEKNLENGTHLRGDINVLLIGDPSTAKSQFLRHMMSMTPNPICTTGRGSSGVGLTAAVVVDKDTGERHLEAGAMVLGDRGIVCIDEFDKMSEADRVAIHEVMEQQTVTIAKAGIHCSLNARCSVLAAANPIYGEYQRDLPPSKNIGFPDSLLSRFDLVFLVLDENNLELDRKIADRVIRNHMFPSETPTLYNNFDEKIIEPELNNETATTSLVFEKHNQLLHGNSKKDILTKTFLRKYLYYMKKQQAPVLTDEAVQFVSQAWTSLRNQEEDRIEYPITVRTLETLIRLATAHAKMRMSKTVGKEDSKIAFDMLASALAGDLKAKEIKINEDEEGLFNKSPKKQISTPKKKRGTMMDVDEQEDTPNKKLQSSSKKKGTAKKGENLDYLFSKNIDTGFVTEELKKYVYKIIHDATHKREYKQIAFDELWQEVTKKDSKKFESVDDLKDVVDALDSSGKILYSTNDKNITLI